MRFFIIFIGFLYSTCTLSQDSTLVSNERLIEIANELNAKDSIINHLSELVDLYRDLNDDTVRELDLLMRRSEISDRMLERCSEYIIVDDPKSFFKNPYVNFILGSLFTMGVQFIYAKYY